MRLAIDDFGTGYSSLAYLKRLPIDVLKIDQSFVRALTTDPADATITQTIVQLAAGLNLTTIAEGVETLEQLLLLGSYGCSRMQGFLFGKPVPARDLRDAGSRTRRSAGSRASGARPHRQTPDPPGPRPNRGPTRRDARGGLPPCPGAPTMPREGAPSAAPRDPPVGEPRILDPAPRSRAAPDASPSTRAAAASAQLPAALEHLIARQRLEVARVEEVTSLRRRESPRRTFRIELADGGLLKARTHRHEEVTERMSRWLPLLATRGFGALRATEGIASLEEWVVGDPVDPADAEAAEWAGALLGTCHAVLPVEVLSEGDPRLVRWGEDALRWIEAIHAAGHLAAAECERLAAKLEALRPHSARWGLYHGDFSPDNLVAGASGVRCVDNTTVRPHLLEVDPGFTFNRWPLNGAVRERFLHGYRRHADPALFLANEPYWRIGAALRSAAYRVRERMGDVGLPLAEIALLVA